MAGFAQASPECLNEMRGTVRRAAGEKSDHRQRRLLRPRRERPGSRRTAEKRDEIAALHARPLALDEAS
jgi:hypothetical protein